MSADGEDATRWSLSQSFLMLVRSERRLYAALFEALRGEDVHRYVAGYTMPNPASAALHAQLGFRAVGVFSEVGRKFGKYWDVCWMERPE